MQNDSPSQSRRNIVTDAGRVNQRIEEAQELSNVPIINIEDLTVPQVSNRNTTSETVDVKSRTYVERDDKHPDELEYKRNGSDQGIVIIFNQAHFDNAKEFRKGSTKDVNNIIFTLGRLGFNIDEKYLFSNLTHSQILEKIEKIGKEDLSDRNSLILFFLTHGSEADKLMARDKELNTKDIWETLERHKDLVNKPKLLVFQACKGGKVSAPFDKRPSKDVQHALSYILPSSDSFPDDVLLCYSSVEGMLSHRDKQKGSWFIQEICRNFMMYGRRDDVLSLFTRIWIRLWNFFNGKPHSIELVDSKYPISEEDLEEAKTRPCTSEEGGILDMKYKEDAINYWKSGKEKRLSVESMQRRFRRQQLAKEKLHCWMEDDSQRSTQTTVTDAGKVNQHTHQAQELPIVQIGTTLNLPPPLIPKIRKTSPEIIDVKSRVYVERQDNYPDELEYARDRKDQGIVIIFNQERFDYEGPRRGSTNDVNNIILTLGRLGYNINENYIFSNLTSYQVLDKIKQIQNEDLSDRNSLILFFLTHGDEKDTLMTKDGILKTDQIWKPLGCHKDLENKPKLFVFQACKGEYISVPFDKKTPENVVHPISHVSLSSYPLPKDILLCYSSVEGMKAYRHIEKGSWFIQEVCNALACIKAMGYLTY
ncbi:hypothetical protein Trydic_g16515 [Trypoxylus dichotomus]